MAVRLARARWEVSHGWRSMGPTRMALLKRIYRIGMHNISASSSIGKMPDKGQRNVSGSALAGRVGKAFRAAQMADSSSTHDARGQCNPDADDERWVELLRLLEFAVCTPGHGDFPNGHADTQRKSATEGRQQEGIERHQSRSTQPVWDHRCLHSRPLRAGSALLRWQSMDR